MSAKYFRSLKTSSVLIVLSLAIVSGVAWAAGSRGGWISSGGEVFLFDRNPWFVKNVTDIHYCFAVDSNSVSIPRAEAHQAFLAAIDFWRKEMNATGVQPMPGIVQLATQNFIEEPCSATVDLAVKLGYGTLDPDEITYLTHAEGEGGPSKRVEAYIGVSIRKAYDLVNMRGQGTLFIASDLGPNAYGNKGQLITEAWKNPKLLQYAFMHELGHIFGVPHTGTGLMSEVFLEQALSTRLSSFYIKNPIQPFLVPPKDFEICSFSGTFNPQFFQLVEDNACLVFQIDLAAGGGGPKWKVFTKKYITSTPVEIGSVNLEISTAKIFGAKPAVTIQLPEGQTVYSALDRGFASFLIGGISNEMDYEGAFRLKSSLKPYPLFASLKTDSITFTAIINNKPIPVLVYVPPTLIKMLIGI